MPVQNLGSVRSGDLDTAIVPLELRRPEPALRSIPDKITEISGALTQSERDQLARDIADIESATAALRRAEPALQSWTKSPAAAVAKARPLWMLIGILWLSTALIAAGALAAIAALAG
jgi:acetate kinase